MIPDLSFYRGRKVLITGSTGFKGSWLSFWLAHMQATVSGFALPPKPWQQLFHSLQINRLINQIDGDIIDAAGVARAVQLVQPEIVFHLAAQPLVRQSYRDPVGTFQTNILGTVNLLEALRQVSSVKAMVIVTSDKCYDLTSAAKPLLESDSLGGYDPYSASKACTELVTASYRDSFFLPNGVGIATARAGNVIGGGDFSPDRIIPDAINALRNGRPVAVRNPSSIRPWQHVVDLLQGYLLLGQQCAREPEQYSSAWNFGPGDNACLTVTALIEKVCSCWGGGSFVRADEQRAPHEASTLLLDTTKSRQLLGWQPNISFEEAVTETVRWYKAYEQGVAMQKITIEQLETVTAMAGVV